MISVFFPIETYLFHYIFYECIASISASPFVRRSGRDGGFIKGLGPFDPFDASFFVKKKDAKIQLRGAAYFLQLTLRRLRLSKGRRRGSRGRCAVRSEDAPLNNPLPYPSCDAFRRGLASAGPIS